MQTARLCILSLRNGPADRCTKACQSTARLPRQSLQPDRGSKGRTRQTRQQQQVSSKIHRRSDVNEQDHLIEQPKQKVSFWTTPMCAGKGWKKRKRRKRRLILGGRTPAPAYGQIPTQVFQDPTTFWPDDSLPGVDAFRRLRLGLTATTAAARLPFITADGHLALSC